MKTNKHIAVKCTYNNGDEGDFVGFHGTCSEDIIKENIKTHVWCSQPDCLCKKYADNGFQGKRPQDPCMESKLFKDWCFGAGFFHTGQRKGKPINANLEAGGICILTTRFPGDKEEDRKIIGLYRIKEVKKGEKEETIFVGDKNYGIRLPLDEAKELYFWDYYSIRSQKPAWRTGLFRYLNDGQVKSILLDLEKTVKSIEHREIIENLLQDFSKITAIRNGLRKHSVTKETREKRIALKRKYGPGGEGDNHKRLKDFVAKNPCKIGLNNVTHVEIEYNFPSGDTVDILFKLQNDKDVIVEIETNDPFPGCYQAIKYRVLRCAERGLPIDSNEVNAVLVAWNIHPKVVDFCNQYGIKYFKIKI